MCIRDRFNSVWGSDSESEPQTLTVHIKWLREKTEKNPKKPEHIITVWGTGYRDVYKRQLSGIYGKGFI